LKKREHIKALDGLRGIALLVVFMHHAFHLKLLWMGVDLFFILSGFLITGILLKNKQQAFGPYIRQFYARRIRRILPAYVVFLFVISCVFGLAWMHHWNLYFGLMNVINWKGIHQPGVMSSLWSLAVEEQFYVLWPLAVFLLNRRALTGLAVVLIVAAPVLRAFSSLWFHNHWATYELLPFRMDTLAFGGLLAIWWENLKVGLLRAKKAVALGVAGCWLVAVVGVLILKHLGISTYEVDPLGDSLIYICTLLMMGSMFLLATSGNLKVLFESRVLAWMARISYSFYLFHLFFLQIVPYGPLAAFAVTAAVSTAMWLLIEKPILRSGRREPTTVTAE
jgi:peptidoglycan/LPS O-acetylase OafA/YrhL